MQTGLRLNVERIRRRLNKLGASADASAFKPEIAEFFQMALADAVKTTPVRNVRVIEESQHQEYQNRINYIPSIHDRNADPRLIVRGGQAFLFSRGKWYRPDIHRLPDAVFADYTTLAEERQRRIASISERAFVDHRKQARFLYRRSWVQAGASVSITVPASSQVMASQTRRKPPKPPLRAYAQWRGGKNTMTLVVFNPFLEAPSRYKPFSGREILAKSIARTRQEFLRKVENKARRLIYAAKKS